MACHYIPMRKLRDTGRTNSDSSINTNGFMPSRGASRSHSNASLNIVRSADSMGSLAISLSVPSGRLMSPQFETPSPSQSIGLDPSHRSYLF